MRDEGAKLRQALQPDAWVFGECARMIRWLVVCLVCFLGTAAFAQSAVGAAAPSPIAGQAEYRLGTGDKLKISVFGEETLSGEFVISGGPGTISFPLIGDVKAAGLTLTELRSAIESELKPDYLKDPHVSIEVLNYRPFYILGEVAKPGEYPYSNGLTVLNAVATANGFTDRANTRNVYIKRAGASSELQMRLDATTLVEPGDTVRIGERFF